MRPRSFSPVYDLTHTGRGRCNLRDTRYLRRLRCGGSGLWLLLGGGLLGSGLWLGGALWLGWLLLSGGLGLSALGRGPEGEVVAEELHDEGAVTVRLL